MRKLFTISILLFTIGCTSDEFDYYHHPSWGWVHALWNGETWDAVPYIRYAHNEIDTFDIVLYRQFRDQAFFEEDLRFYNIPFKEGIYILKDTGLPVKGQTSHLSVSEGGDVLFAYYKIDPGVETSFLEIKSANESLGLMKGSFDIYLDSNGPSINSHFTKKLHLTGDFFTKLIE